MIKVRKFIGSLIKTTFAGQDLYKLQEPVYAEVSTNEGNLCYYMKPGFITNMRSGSHAIDWLIPKFTNNNQYNLALLCHDFAYTRNSTNDHYLSRELADELLRQMCIISGELGRVRATIMYRALRIGGGSAYEEDNTGYYKGVEQYMNFLWKDK